MNLRCPHCGAPLPAGASFCPHCAQNLRPRREMDTPVRRWLKPLKRTLLLLVLAALGWAGWLVYDALAPDVYEAWGELTYNLNGNDYHLFLTCRTDAVPEAAHTMQVEDGGVYDRVSRLFVTHVDSGQDAGRAFFNQMDQFQTRVIQPPDSPSPVVCSLPIDPNDPYDGLALTTLDFTGRSQGPVEVEWTITMKNGDTIFLRQKIDFQRADTAHYYPEDYDMDTIEDLQALVDQIQAEVPLSTVVRIHLPPVTYEGGLTIHRRGMNLSGSTDEQNRRTTFLGPVVLSPEEDPLCDVEHIDFVGNGTGTGLTVAAQYRVLDCSFTGWDIGLLVGGEAWANPKDCLFTDNDIGFRFDSGGDYCNYTDFTNNTFRNNTVAVDLLRVPGLRTIDFTGCLFDGNVATILNPNAHAIDTGGATFT